MIDAEFAAAMARTALRNVATEYPYKLDQVLGSDDACAPRALHPAFHGSYDWHSCVHMHWTLARLLRIHPHHPDADATRRTSSSGYCGELHGELATFSGPHRGSFERPYGWGWLLKLAAELKLLAAEDRRARWFAVLAPLAQAFADRFIDFLPRARIQHAPELMATRRSPCSCTRLLRDRAAPCAASLDRRARQPLVRPDRRYPAEYEPSGDDFLSSGLVEAALMRRVIDGCSFTDWWGRFQPAHDVISSWLQPAQISDASDPKIVHLHGLNLSRAWCWRQLLPSSTPLQRAG